MQKCLKPAFSLTASRGRLHWLQKEVRLYKSLRENDLTSQLIHYLNKHFPNEIMVSIPSFKSSIQHDVHFVNYGPIYSKTDNKAAYALGRGYLVIVATSAPQVHPLIQIWSLLITSSSKTTRWRQSKCQT